MREQNSNLIFEVSKKDRFGPESLQSSSKFLIIEARRNWMDWTYLEYSIPIRKCSIAHLLSCFSWRDFPNFCIIILYSNSFQVLWAIFEINTFPAHSSKNLRHLHSILAFDAKYPSPNMPASSLFISKYNLIGFCIWNCDMVSLIKP